MNSLLNWAKLLLAAFIQGAATSITVIIVDPVAFNFAEQWQKTATLAFVSGIVGAALYLKQSPLPGINNDGERIIRSLLVFALVTLPFSAATCSGSSGFKKAVQANHNLSVGLVASTKVLAALYDQKMIDGTEYLQIIALEQQVLESAKEFNNQLIKAQQIDTTNKQAFLVIVDALMTSLENLHQQGVLRIKSDNSKAAFTAAMATAKISLGTIRAFIAAVKDTAKVPAQAKADLNIAVDQLAYWINYSVLQQKGVFAALAKEGN